VKVIMNGFFLPNYLTMRTLVAKVLSLTLTLGSGLPVGKEASFGSDDVSAQDYKIVS